jgi:small conductance mechanosensitive channel
MSEFLDMVIRLAIEFAINIVVALVIVAVGRWAARYFSNLLCNQLRKRKVEESLVRFLGNVVNIVILIVAILAALNVVGIQTTSMVALVGAAGFAIGLAMEGALSNFSAGVLILLFKPFVLNDVVEIAGETGNVDEILLFNTILITFDNKKVIIPNAQVTGGIIINYTAMETRRVDMVFGIGYDDDLLKAKTLLQEMVIAEERVLSNPPPAVFVLELADSSVNLAVRPYVKTDDYLDVMSDFTEQVKLRFDEEGLRIPYPQQDVHIHKVEG